MNSKYKRVDQVELERERCQISEWETAHLGGF